MLPEMVSVQLVGAGGVVHDAGTAPLHPVNEAPATGEALNTTCDPSAKVPAVETEARRERDGVAGAVEVASAPLVATLRRRAGSAAQDRHRARPRHARELRRNDVGEAHAAPQRGADLVGGAVVGDRDRIE